MHLNGRCRHGQIAATFVPYSAGNRSDILGARTCHIIPQKTNFLSKVITGDGSRVCDYDSETKQQHSQRKSPLPACPRMTRHVRSYL
jgi:hypothetical protein